MNKKNILATLPYLYFIGLILWMVYDNQTGNNGTEKSLVPLFFAIPFVVQLFLKSKTLDVFLVAICGVFTFYMSLAFLSDVFDIAEMTKKARNFLILGGLFTIGNILMTTLLVFNLIKKTPRPCGREKEKMKFFLSLSHAPE